MNWRWDFNRPTSADLALMRHSGRWAVHARDRLIAEARRRFSKIESFIPSAPKLFGALLGTRRQGIRYSWYRYNYLASEFRCEFFDELAWKRPVGRTDSENRRIRQSLLARRLEMDYYLRLHAK